MRVLFVTRKYPPRVGGMESLSHGLTTGYPKPNTLIALRRSQKNLFWFLPYAIARVALTGHRYDVIHLGDAMLSVAGLVPRLLYRKPVAISVHGLDLTWPKPWYQAYLRHFLRAEVFIANSESTRRIAEARGISPVRTITIGVPEHYFAIARAPSADPEFERRRSGRAVLVTVGRLVRRKGVAWFVRHVLPQLPGVLYVVVGVGPEHDEIVRAASETGTTDQLWLAGKVSEAALRDLLGATDVFVMPNIEVPGDVEGFGIVAVEAAASGVPVVAARLEGIPDAIADGENGELIESGDAGGFVDALTRLLKDTPERLRRGQRGREFTLEHNAWPRIIADYVETFSEIAARGVG
ncbi:MAG TPA: glycosyltransferase family 4 protein [Polyangiaceae bacterium]|nr:glycosyltransferase family 4 protein [Polyangiaceae bacterium]